MLDFPLTHLYLLVTVNLGNKHAQLHCTYIKKTATEHNLCLPTCSVEHCVYSSTETAEGLAMHGGMHWQRFSLELDRKCKCQLAIIHKVKNVLFWAVTWFVPKNEICMFAIEKSISVQWLTQNSCHAAHGWTRYVGILYCMKYNKIYTCMWYSCGHRKYYRWNYGRSLYMGDFVTGKCHEWAVEYVLGQLWAISWQYLQKTHTMYLSMLDMSFWGEMHSQIILYPYRYIQCSGD